MKYPAKIGDTLHPAGTIVRVASIQEAQQLFPGIQQNDASTMIAVFFPDMAHATVVLAKQVSHEH